MKCSDAPPRQLPARTQGLEHTDLMTLKPPLPPKKDGAAAGSGVQGARLAPAPAESFLGRRSGGFCLAFLGCKDGREYLVGAGLKPLAATNLPCSTSHWSYCHLCICAQGTALHCTAVAKHTAAAGDVRTHGTADPCMQVACTLETFSSPRHALQARTTATSTSARWAARTATWTPTAATWAPYTRCAAAPACRAPSSRLLPTAPCACGARAGCGLH